MMFCHIAIIDSVIICTSSTQNELVVKDSNDIQKSTYYILIEVVNCGKSYTTNVVTFPIVHFPFTSSNILPVPMNGVYILQLMR